VQVNDVDHGGNPKEAGKAAGEGVGAALQRHWERLANQSGVAKYG
jgi:hypothetical protein